MQKNNATNYKRKYRYRFMCCLIIVAISTALFFEVWSEFVTINNQTGHLTGRGNFLMAIAIYVILFVLFMRGLGGYRIGVDRKANLLAAQVMVAFMTDLCEILLSIAITGQFRFALNFAWRYLLLAIGQSVINCLLVVVMVNNYRRIFPPIRVLEIYGSYENNLANKVNTRADKYNVCESISIDAGDNRIEKLIDKYDAVLINDIPSGRKNKILKYCYEIDKRVYFTPKISDILVRSSEDLNLFDTPLLLCKNQGMSRGQKILKRAFDIVLSGIALIVASPFMLITAIAIKFEDHGPVFYKQERCTLDNKTFMILKFRSMIVDAEKDGKPHPAGQKDDRITKVGSFIRACRMDELPQLINIIKGDMSIVGPRPERVEHVEKYTAEIPEFALRCKVRGGLTGYAQVYGKYNTSALDKLKMDMMYVTNYSLLLDLQIIFETVKIIVQKEATEGFESDDKKMAS